MGPPVRVRFRYAKQGKIRFTSQRDVARMWERALRRSGLPVAWSEGFSPRPLLSFGLALPTGAESLGEYVDVRLAPGPGPPDPAADLRREVLDALGRGGRDLAALLGPLMPEGITVQASALVDHATGSLQQEVTSCDWEMEVHGVAPRELTARVERLLGSPSVVVRRERKGRPVEDDLRPGVRTLAVVADGTGSSTGGQARCRLRAELATRPRGVRPGELLEVLGAGVVLDRACRTHQWIERDGERREPLSMGGELPEASGHPARERAS
ncbi:MAG: TIGR03936 family radical SAM-associated protein [Acidimicrobiales bacterium]